MHIRSKTPPLAILVTVLGGLWSSGNPARAAAQQADTFDLEGAITKQSQGKLTVDSGQGILFHVVYDDKTTIVGADGKPGTGDDFKVGIRVHVLGEFDDAGQVKARRIEIEPVSHDSSPPPPQS